MPLISLNYGVQDKHCSRESTWNTRSAEVALFYSFLLNVLGPIKIYHHRRGSSAEVPQQRFAKKRDKSKNRRKGHARRSTHPSTPVSVWNLWPRIIPRLLSTYVQSRIATIRKTPFFTVQKDSIQQKRKGKIRKKTRLTHYYSIIKWNSHHKGERITLPS